VGPVVRIWFPRLLLDTPFDAPVAIFEVGINICV
jgi:hypothetical protein